MRFPHMAQRYVGAHSRGCKRYGASPIANIELSIQEQDAVLAIDRQRFYFFGGGATFLSHQSNLVEPSFASLPGMSEFSLSLTPE